MKIKKLKNNSFETYSNKNYFFFSNEKNQIKVVKNSLLSEIKKPFKIYKPAYSLKKHPNSFVVNVFYDAKCFKV